MNVISILAIVITIISVAGGSAAYFKSSRGDSIIKYQATEIELRNGTIANLRADLAASNESSNAKDQTIAELRKHVEYLQKLGQGSPQLKKLTLAIENQTVLITELVKRFKS